MTMFVITTMFATFLIFLGPMAIQGVPLSPEDFENNNSQTVIDPNNLSQQHIQILQQHNVNLTELQYQRANRANKSTNSFYPTVVLDAVIPTSAQNSTASDAVIETRKQLALASIRNKVSLVIMQNDTTDTSAHHSTQPIHDIAVYSLCPSTNPILDIFRANNNSFNLYFDPPAPTMNDKRMYLSSAILRLFKVDRTGGNEDVIGVAGSSSNNGDCRWNPAHADELIRVTVSAYTKKSRKYRKKTFNSIMIQKAYSGWVELHVRFIIGQWQRRNLGLSVDVHDQDENQLVASQFFHPSNCEASDKPFPFTQFQSTYTDSCHKAVPRFPRIDYQYKFCDKSRLKESVYNKRCHQSTEKKTHHRHQHQFHHHPHPHHRNSLSRSPYKPFASFERPTATNVGQEEDIPRHRAAAATTTPAPEDVVDFVTA